jgi:VanZ family protein
LLIVYGSLYPWHFTPVHLAANPLWILLHSWRRQPWRYLISDVIVNVALYIPLGFVGHLAFRKTRPRGFGIYGPVLLGLLLSTAMELTQLLEPSRNTSMIDVITNAIGSGFGVMAGLVFEALASGNGSSKHKRTLGLHVVDRGALLLAFCWAAWLFFPFLPVIGRYVPSRKVAVFMHSRVFDAEPLVSAAAFWFAGGLLATAAGVRIPRGWFLLTLLAVPAQLFVVDQQPLPAVLVGAGVGVILFIVCYRGSAPTLAEALIFLAVILFRGLSPFDFVAGSTEFNWIPFGATLGATWQSAARILIEKMFYYGTAIWMLRAAGVRLVRSVTVVAVILSLIEVAQMRLPGRTAEITDPILAILMGFVLAMLSVKVRAQRAVSPE